jgi:GNAT superfamily N-acetyltransferase
MGILCFFGANFLKKMYLNHLAEGNWGLVITKNKKKPSVVGFIFAIKKDVSLLRCLTISSIFFFIKQIVHDTRKLETFILAMIKIYWNKSDFRFTEDRNNKLELAHFVINKDYQSKGLGSKLLLNFELKAKKEGFNLVFTRTHNKKLMVHYTEKKNAVVYSKTALNNYSLYVLEWHI